MTSLFRRRGKEPPSTGHFGASRRRQPVDPPAADPVIHQNKNHGDPVQRKQLPAEENQHAGQKVTAGRRNGMSSTTRERKRTPSFEDENIISSTDSIEENENKPAVNMLQAQTQQANKTLHVATSSGLNSRDIDSKKSPRPFSTKSNKEAMTKSLAVASKLNKDSRATAGRGSVFRKIASSDNDTVVSVASAKSAATAKSAVTTGSRTTAASKRNSANSSAAASDHDKAALRILLGSSGPVATTKPTLSSVSERQAAKPAKPIATTSISKPSPSVDEKFDQKEYLRSLISMKKAQTSSSATHKAVTSSNKVGKTTIPSLPNDNETKESAKSGRGGNDRSEKAAMSSISTKSSTTSSSSTSAAQKAILRKVLAKTMTKKSGEDKARRKLSPKNKPSKLENAAVSISRKVLSDQSKPLTPKKKSMNFKGYVRSKMGLSRKASQLTAKPKSPNASYIYGSGLATSSSVDSVDSSVARSISQVGSHASDMSDDDKTKTTLASSSNDSGVTKHSYETSLKGLSTAETIDTDESSTIMGNLQSASSDSMQYSSEEGCDDNTVINSSAFQAIDNVSRMPATLSATYSVVTSKQSKSVSNHHIPELAPNALAATKQHQGVGYSKFLKTLQSEASGSHSQLWSSFQAVMTGSPRRAPANRGVSQFKFDPVTRQMLAVMNSHLKGQAMVECVTTTQLVNDKKFAKEIAIGLTSRPSFSLEEMIAKKALEETECLAVGNRDATPKPNEAANKVVSVERAAPIVSCESLDCQHKAIAPVIEGSEHASLEQHQKPTLGPFGNLQVEAHNQVSNANAHSLAAPSIALKPFSHRKTVGLSPKRKGAPVPWSGVQLRSVSNAETPSSSSTVDKHQNKQGAAPSPWLKVKLRRISLEEKESSEREQSEQEEMLANDPFAETCRDGNMVKDGPDACFEKQQSNDEPPREQDLEMDDSRRADGKTSLTPDTEKAGSEVVSLSTGTRKCKPSPESPASSGMKKSAVRSMPSVILPMSKDHNRTVSDGTDEQTSASACVLERENLDKFAACAFVVKSTEGGSDSDKARVVLDKENVTMCQSTVGASEAPIIWTFPRDQIKSLKLDMESQRVNLSLVSGAEPTALSFMNSTDCLKFANAFYEMQNPAGQEQTATTPATDNRQTNHQLTALNHEEQQVLETYRQARRTKPAGDAIRTVVHDAGATVHGESAQKNQGTDTSILSSSSNSNGNEANEQVVPLSEKDKKVAEAYVKMLKLRIPPDAVKHKMVMDGVDPKIVAFVLGKTTSLAANAGCPDNFSTVKVEKKEVESVLSVAEEAVAAPYRKMLKMMIPKDAVRHKMMKDQVEAKIMVAVVGGGDDSPKSKQTIMTAGEEAIASTYRKMLKLRMPPEAVHHRMKKEGVSDKIVKAVLGIDEGKCNAAGPKGGSVSKAAHRGSKLVSLHWTPLSGTDLDNSVWGATKTRKVAVAQPEGSDISKLVELFQKKSTTKIKKGKAEGTNSDSGSGKAKLLDLNRANIMAISLKAFKDFSHDELAEILRTLDPSRKLKGERLQFVRDLLPTAAEASTIKRYFGSPDRLVPAEIWFQKIAHIKRLEAKAQVLHTMEVFESEVAEVQQSLHLLTRVCNQVTESERLRELLDMVLQIGNIMNEGTRTGGASGFKFDSLLRLTQTKSGDGKTTVLDYIVTIYAAKGQRQTLNLIEDFPECQMASRMVISDLVSNVKDAHEKMQQCQKEYDALVAQSTAKGEAVSLKKTAASTGTADPRLQLLSAITAGGAESKKNSLLDAIKSQNQAPKGVKSTTERTKGAREGNENSPQDAGLQAGIARLCNFLTTAEKTFETLKSDRDLAVETCRGLSKYCGEGGGERATDTLLGILSEFASNMQAAVTKHDRAMQAEAKKQSRQNATPKKQRRNPEEARSGSSPAKRKPSPLEAKKDNGKDSKVPTKQRQSSGPKPQGKGTSLVLMVNELLREANEKTKNDFSQGVVYEAPGAKLKAIYDREKHTKRNGVPPLPSGRRSMDGDLLTTIKKRQGEAGEVAAKAKRSQLERVIDCINCASDVEDITESPSGSSCGTLSDCSDHSSISPSSKSCPLAPIPVDHDIRAPSANPATVDKATKGTPGNKAPLNGAAKTAGTNESAFSRTPPIVSGTNPVKVTQKAVVHHPITPERRTTKAAKDKDSPSMKPGSLKTFSLESTSSSIKAPLEEKSVEQPVCTIKSSPKPPAARTPNKKNETPTDRFKDLESLWNECKSTPRRLSASSSICQEDEGSVHQPIDCTTNGSKESTLQ